MGVKPQKVRALSLLSGGLDSQLAICLLRAQDIEVEAIVFDSPFFDLSRAMVAARNLGVFLHTVDMTKELVELIEHPPHGFGACMNPCIDCHTVMLSKTGDFMQEGGYHMMATGEVLNQRPMSQTRKNLATVARDSGYADFILRPLSAQLLTETKPERDGLVDRSRLLAIDGRGRRRQMRLAAEYGIKDYPQPAGGCRLTEPNFCTRLKDLHEHEGIGGTRALQLLRYGRHFRLDERVKMIVGRNEQDNAYLEGTAELYDLILKVEEFPGPTCILPFTANEQHIHLAATICARYSDLPPGTSATVRVRSSRGMHKLDVPPAAPEDAERLRI